MWFINFHANLVRHRKIQTCRPATAMIGQEKLREESRALERRCHPCTCSFDIAKSSSQLKSRDSLNNSNADRPPLMNVTMNNGQHMLELLFERRPELNVEVLNYDENLAFHATLEVTQDKLEEILRLASSSWLGELRRPLRAGHAACDISICSYSATSRDPQLRPTTMRNETIT